MQIEVFEQLGGLRGPEVVVRVLANEVVDLDDVKLKLTEAQANMIKEHRLFQYYPHLVTASERAEHGYPFEDFWIFRPVMARSH